MLLIFCLQRPDVMSFEDLGIHRGLRMLYHHEKIDRKLFGRYAKRYSPCGSVASLYLWEIAGGAYSGAERL
jgi:DNA-3-methyladenine glycosylase II